MASSLPGTSVHGIVKARMQEWVRHFLIQGIISTQGSKPCLLCLLHWQSGSLPLGHLGSPISSLYEGVKQRDGRGCSPQSTHTPVREARTCKSCVMHTLIEACDHMTGESWLVSFLEEGPWKDQEESARWGEASGKKDTHVLRLPEVKASGAFGK